MYMSGAHHKMATNPGLYRRLLEQEAEPLLVEVIEKGRFKSVHNFIKKKEIMDSWIEY